MAKPPLPRVTEPDERLVHYKPSPLADAVTLCGLTDFIGATRGEDTDEPVNCALCRDIKKFCDNHRK